MRDLQIDTLIEEKTSGIEPAKFNPFPGLRPFSIDESHLFFGREGQSEKVIKNLSKFRFSAVTGASGSGKSSLIYCGLIPLLYGGFIVDAGSKWRIITCRPGNSPIENLADAFVESEKEANPHNINEYTKTIIQTVLKRSHLGLVDAVKQLKTAPDENILIIFDQFEELFRFKESRKDSSTINETEAYIKLLVESIQQTEVPIYSVLTMRSDFVGECSQFHDLTELINKSNYLIPQMSREDFRKAIEGPVAVGGAKIDPQLVQQLLNTVGNNTDQLSVLQHALMRTWDHWTKYSTTDTPILSRNYESIGKMEQALSLHADEAYEELTPEGRRVCEKLFKTLTERGEDSRGIRHPSRIDMIAKIASARTDEVIDVIENFRKRGRSFLTPSPDTPLTAETVIDISHESIMRIWDRLKTWVEEEAQAVQMYIRLADASALFQVGKTSLWRPPDLHLAIKWRQKQQPTLTWAKRYNPAFERAMVFLESSENRYKAEERNKIRLQKRALRRTQIFALVLGVASLIMMGLMFYANQQRLEAEKNKSIAENLKELAEQAKDAAIEDKNVAVEQKSMEEQRREMAEKARLQAQKAKELSEENERLALENEELARRQREQAVAQKDEAVTARKEVEKTLEETTTEKNEAEKEKEREFRQKMLSTAKSMALKSKTESDPNLKLLLAAQSCIFNEEHDGDAFDNDIYSGLYKAIAAVKGESYNSLKGHSGEVRAIAFVPGSSIFYTTGADGKIIKRNINNPAKYSVFYQEQIIYRSIAISKNGQYLAAGTFDGKIHLFNLKTGNNTPTVLIGHQERSSVGSVVFMPDNKSLISIANDRLLLKWNLDNFKSTTIDKNTSRFRSIDVSPDGSKIVAGMDDGKLIIWNTSSNSSKIVFQSVGNPIYSVAFNARGTRIVSGDKEGTVKIWNASTNRLIKPLKGHTSRIVSVNFSPDNSLIASSSYDGTVRIWSNIDLSNDPIKITEHESWVFTTTFSSDSKKIVTSSQKDNLVFAWASKSKYMVDEICTLVKRNFLDSEWEKYVGNDIPYEKTCENLTE